MPIPVVFLVSMAAEALPVFAGFIHRGRLLPAPVRWTLVWCAITFLGDVAAVVVAFLGHENLVLLSVTIPLDSALCLWALSCWQPHDALRRVYQATIVLLLVCTYLIVLFPGSRVSPDAVLWPLHTFLLLLASVQTLLHRTLRAEYAITREPWFWVTLGLSIYFGTAVAIRPFAGALIESNPDWVRLAYIVRAWLGILAFALITVGIVRAPALPLAMARAAPGFRPAGGAIR